MGDADLHTAAERWHLTEHGALLYGDDTGGITVAGLAAWKDCPERTEAIRALARWCDEAISSAAALAAATEPPRLVHVCSRCHVSPPAQGSDWCTACIADMEEHTAAGPVPDPQGTDEPTDDDLRAENWWLREALANSGRDFGKERVKRSEIAAELRDVLAEVERLRAAAPASEAVSSLFDAVAETVEQIAPRSGADPTPLAEEDAAALILWTYQVLRDEFSTTPNKQGEGWDGNDNRSRTRTGDGRVLQGTEGAGLQRGSRRDADGAGLRDRAPQASPEGLTVPPCAVSPVEAGDSHGRPDVAGSPPPTPADEWEVFTASDGEQAIRLKDPPPPPTPAPTREQVELILSRHWGGDGTTRVTEATDAVMALIARPDREPLWRGTTADSNEHEFAPEGKSYLAECLLDTPPGTAVRVDHDHQSTESEHHHGQDQR